MRMSLRTVQLDTLKEYPLSKCEDLCWDLVRSHILIAMNGVQAKFQAVRDNGVSVVFKPKQQQAVKANKAFAAKQLTLVAFTTNIVKSTDKIKIPDDSICMDLQSVPMGESVKASLVPLRQYPPDGKAPDGKAQKQNPCIIPYWFVGTTPHAKAANLESAVLEEPVAGLNIGVPVLRNTVPIKKGAELLMYKAP